MEQWSERQTCGKSLQCRRSQHVDSVTLRDFWLQLFIFLFTSFANLCTMRVFFQFRVKRNYRPLNNFQEENVFAARVGFFCANETLVDLHKTFN